VNGTRRPNPYDFVGDVKDPRFFAGRRAELAATGEEILRLTATPSISSIIALVGERRVGKTSILHRIAEFAHKNHILPCRVNLITSVAADPWEFWHETLQAVLSSAFQVGALHVGDSHGLFGFHSPAPAVPRSGSPIPEFAFARLYLNRPAIGGPPLPPSVALINDFTAISEAVSREGYVGSLFLFDEAHFLAESSEIMQQLRHIVRSVPGMALVFSGEPSLNQIFTNPAAPFYLQAKIVPVENFMARYDVAECVLLPLTESERPLVSPMTIDHLARLSHGKPNQIRLLCHSIYRRYESGSQDDLNITIEALDAVLDTIQTLYAAEYDLRERVDLIRRLRSVDLETLYLATRYPHWRVEDIVTLDEAFRGERLGPRAARRRTEQLEVKHKKFVAMRLLQDRSDKYVLAGDEFLYLYLRFWYEVRKRGDLSRRLDLGEGPPTAFGEKVDKLIRSLAWENGRVIKLLRIGFAADESPREQVIVRIRQRFAVLDDVVGLRSLDAASRARSLTECFDVCELIGTPGQYYLLVLAVRNLENPRESILAEVYLKGTDPITFPLTLMREQAEAATILVEEFDAWCVSIPSLEDLVKASSGRELQELMDKLGPVEAWMLKSIRRLVAEPHGSSAKDKRATGDSPDEDGTWIKLYQKGDKIAAIEAITRKLAEIGKRPAQARLHNDRGYIRYGVKEQIDLAKRDLQRAIDLHHQSLALTLLNLAIIAIDASDFEAGIEHINDALLLTLGRESLSASYLRLRLLPGNLWMARQERWEQHPANVLEAAYVNLGYAVAQTKGYEAAQEVFQEGRELIPSSARLTHALARLHLWRRRADLADPFYKQLGETEISDHELRREVETYRHAGRRGGHKK